MAKDQLLLLRRRRDGTVALVDAQASVSSPERGFPGEHDFLYDWVALNADIARLDGDTLRLELCNGRAEYRVTTRGPTAAWPIVGVRCELVGSELFDAPPVDEERAVVVVAAARERRVGEFAEEFALDANTAERILVRLGQMRPATEANTAQAGEG